MQMQMIDLFLLGLYLWMRVCENVHTSRARRKRVIADCVQFSAFTDTVFFRNFRGVAVTVNTFYAAVFHSVFPFST